MPDIGPIPEKAHALAEYQGCYVQEQFVDQPRPQRLLRDAGSGNPNTLVLRQTLRPNHRGLNNPR
jgi:hypothetical protein